MYERYLADILESELKNMRNIKLYGEGDKIGIVALNIGDLDSVYVEKMLGDRFAVRGGFHCAPLAHKALDTLSTGIVRVSFGAFSKKREITKFVDRIYQISKSSLG